MAITMKVEKTTGPNTTEELTVITPMVYDWVKRVVQVVFPAFSALYLGVSELNDWDNSEQVVGAVALITTFLGVCLGISSSRYKESDAGTSGEFIVTEDEGGPAGFRLALNDPPELMADQQKVTFKVVKVPA